ncbi:MAG: energy transducer TonB [Deltaproteobacteria bacterium]|nr:energy transducer TonB [Deltaproteobacteria bacterium]
MFFKPKERLFGSPGENWFPSWPFVSSLLLHCVTAYILMIWNFPHPSEPVPRVVTVQIVEEKKEDVPAPPPPSRPKRKEIREIVHPKPETRPVAPQKEEAHPFPPILQAAEQKIPQVLPVSDEKIGVEEKPPEEWMAKAEPGRWGDPEGPREAEPIRLGKEERPTSLIADSGSAPKGIPGGLAAVNPWGKGAGGEAGFPGGVEGGKGTVPPKGAKTGSVYFMGEGKGRGDLGSYLGNARMRIEKAKRYPREARRRGWEGKVILSFQINRKGEVAQIRLVQSSGYQELDEEGIATIRRASPFLPLPVTEERGLEVEIPLVFRLEERR